MGGVHRLSVCQLVRNSLRGECPALSSHSSAGPGWRGVCLGCRVTRRSGLGDSDGGSAAPGGNVGADTGTQTHGCDVWHTCITPCDIRLEHPEGVEPCSARLGRPATRPACWNAKSPGTFPCWGLLPVVRFPVCQRCRFGDTFASDWMGAPFAFAQALAYFTTHSPSGVNTPAKMRMASITSSCNPRVLTFSSRARRTGFVGWI